MPWTSRAWLSRDLTDFGRELRRGASRPAPWSLAVLMIAACALLLSGAPEEKRIAIYSNAANYSLTVVQRNGMDYIGLLEVVEPLGTVSAKVSGGHWRFRYNDTESEFTPGQSGARVRNNNIALPGPFLLEGSRGLVPLSSLAGLLPRILGGPVTFNQSARRLFIGNVAVHFTAQVTTTTPPKLVVNFTSPVNPVISTEPGKVRMVFTREPVVAPSTPALTFDSKIIPAAEFQEHNGEAELIVSGTVPLMASFSNDGRTITISPPQAVTAQTQPQATAPAQGVIGLPSAPSGPLAGTPRYVAVIDAAHGGDERGAALTEQIAEKDVTLAFARRLRQELDSRNLATLLVRDSDITLTADQRATTVNGTDPAIYISVHAAAQGNGVRLYTALLASGGENHGPLIDWDTAQASFQAISQAAATSVGAELRSKQVPVRTLVAPLRPLNNIITASIALEIAPPAGDITQLNAPAYQQLIAGAVAAGVADIRDQLEAGRK